MTNIFIYGPSEKKGRGGSVEKLDIVHHKIILLVIMLVVLVTGMLFGVKLSYAAGADGLAVISFALQFLTITLLFLVFIQQVHVSDWVRPGKNCDCPEPKKTVVKKSTKKRSTKRKATKRKKR